MQDARASAETEKGTAAQKRWLRLVAAIERLSAARSLDEIVGTVPDFWGDRHPVGGLLLIESGNLRVRPGNWIAYGRCRRRFRRSLLGSASRNEPPVSVVHRSWQLVRIDPGAHSHVALTIIYGVWQGFRQLV